MKLIVVAVALAVGTASSSAFADEYPDGCKVEPKNCKLLKEDDTFRVIDYTAHAGDKVGMHSHPAHVVYVLEGGKAKFTMPDGTTKEIDAKPGEVIINPPTVHASVHESDIHVIIVERKK
jgi:quercetin dioxygenase-like cupin family protein